MKRRRTRPPGSQIPPRLLTPEASEISVQPALTVYFGYCLYKSALRLRAMIDAQLEQYGIIAPQLSVMKLLDVLGDKSQVEIGRELGVDCASMVKLIDTLESLKLVQRSPSPEDRRANRVTLTLAGKKLLKEASKVRESVEQKFLSPLSPTEQKVLREAMPKLLRQAD